MIKQQLKITAMKTTYLAVSTEKRFTEDSGHFNLFSIEKRFSTRKAIENWIDQNSHHECEVMTEKQYEKAIISQNF
jgi:hypothetical protein